MEPWYNTPNQKQTVLLEPLDTNSGLKYEAEVQLWCWKLLEYIGSVSHISYPISIFSRLTDRFPYGNLEDTILDLMSEIHIFLV